MTRNKGKYLWAVFLLFLCAGSAKAGEVMTLRAAIDRVALDGRQVRIAVDNTVLARDEAEMAGSPLLPQVNAQAGYTAQAYQMASLAGGQKLNTAQKNFDSLGVDVYQTLYDFGADRSNLKAARALVKAFEADEISSKNQSVLNVITAYVDILEAGRMEAAAREELSSLASHSKDVAIFFREGVVTRNEFLAARVQFSFARQQLVTWKDQQKRARAHLAQILSMKSLAIAVVTDVEVNIPQGLTLDSVRGEALEGRPELKKMSHDLSAAGFSEDAVRASKKPTIFADSGYAYTDNRYMSRDDNWYVKLGVKMNIFNGGLTKAEIARAHSRQEMLKEQRAALEEEIGLQTEKGFWDLRDAKALLTSSRSARDQAREDLRVTRTQYKEGSATSSAVLDAITRLARAETGYWHGTYEVKRGYARLLFAMGRDLRENYMSDARQGERCSPVTKNGESLCCH